MNYITRIQNSIDYIEDNLTEPLSIEQISRAACFSPFHFQRLFRVATGSAVKEYLRKRRLSAALTELKLSNKKVIEIAFDYQYESPEAFSRAFYAAYRMYPADYRNGNKVLNTFPRIELNSHIIPDKSKNKKDNKMNNEIKIVPYSHEYAEAVAEMWREMSGSEETRGRITDKTKEQVIDEENSSVYLELLLAIEDEKVIGYCKLMIDTDFEDVLFISIFDGISEKANQPLIDAALQKTVELGYSRLDIYSPLIGKVNSRQLGFMRKFDNRLDTHSNYLPLFAKTELIKELFSQFDPLKDSTRIIPEEEDIAYGSPVNWFTYSWRKSNDELSVQIDGVRQFGIKKIETAEFYAELSITNPQIIFDQPNEAVFTIRNKTAKPLQAVLKNLKNSDLDFVLDKTVEIKDELILKSSFTVKTSAGKATDLSINLQINGKSAAFSLGLIPQPVLNISAEEKQTILKEGEEYQFELVMENNLDQALDVSFKLPKEEALVFNQYEYQVNLVAKEKLVLPIEFKLLATTIWRTALKFKINCADKIQYKLEKKLGLTMPTLDGIYYSGGEATIGRHRLLLSNNRFASWCDDITRFDLRGRFLEHCVWFGTCKFVRVGEQDLLLKPQPDSVDFEQESGSVKISRTYSPVDSNRLKIIEIFTITLNGVIKRQLEVKNNSTKPIHEPITVYNQFYINHYNWIIPYQNRLVTLKEQIENNVAFWNSADFTENWIYADKTGVSWPKKDKFFFDIYYPYFGVEQTIQGIGAGAMHRFEAVTGANHTFDNWHSFREFVLQKKLEPTELTDCLNLTINNGNPFVDNQLTFKIEEIKKPVDNNSLKVRLNNSATDGLEKKSEAGNLQKYQLNLAGEKQNLMIVDAVLYNSLIAKQFTKAVFPKGKEIVITQITTEQNCRVFTADNGLIQIKASPDFAPVLYSCVFNGVECFDNAFPKVTPKDCFGEWAGGATLNVNSFTSQNQLFHQKYVMEFTQMSDNLGNHWSGIKIIIHCDKNPPMEGETIECYFLLLPDSPVLHTFIAVRSKNGKISSKCYYGDMFLNPKLGTGAPYFAFKDKNGHLNKVRCGLNSYEIFNKTLSSYQFVDAPFKIIRTHSHGLYSAHGICDFTSLYDGPVPEKQPLHSQFLIFTDKDLETEWLKDLDNIKFDLS